MSKTKDFILQTFLELTSETYPYGTEDLVIEKMIRLGMLPDGIEKDQHGNYFLQVGDSRTIFASHLDTVSKDQSQVVHLIEGDIVKTDGKTILGADDKAGVTIMLFMIKNNIPGLYYFFIGEEVGCIGSGLAAKYGDFKNKYDRMISFDRRGTDSVITFQSSSRCCSDEFANQLANQLNKSKLSYKKDDTGVYTDSAEFVSVIPECTNLSVGYYKEHTNSEHQDISHLVRLAEACLLVKWESLATRRDMSKTEYKSYYSSSTNSNWRTRDFDYGYDYGYGRGKKNKKRGKHRKSYGYYDDWYDQNSSFNSHNNFTSFTTPGKSYYDGANGLVEIKDKQLRTFNEFSYDWIMTKILDHKLTRDKLDLIKEQYLDMNDFSDKAFYSYLEQLFIEQNL